MLRGLLSAAVCLAATPRLSAEPDYARDIKPLLRAKCYACHGAIRQKGGLRLDAGQLVLKGTKRGEVIIPGEPDKSPLVETTRTVAAPAPNRAGHILAQAVQCEISVEPSSGSVVPSWSQRSIRCPSVSHTTSRSLLLRSGPDGRR